MKANQKTKQEEDQIIFEGNTFPFPNFIVDSGFLATLQGSPTLKTLLVILRHSTGFKHDTMSLSNSVIAKKSGIKHVKQITRAKKELKEKYKIIDYNQSKGGRDIQNIKVLLPEKFYNKDLNSLENAAKYLEKYGYKVLAPETKGDKKEVLQISENRTSMSIIEDWNNFFNWSLKTISRGSQEILKNCKVSFDGNGIFIKNIKEKKLQELILKYFKDNNSKAVLIFEEGL